jgi:hypothetical protein
MLYPRSIVVDLESIPPGQVLASLVLLHWFSGLGERLRRSHGPGGQLQQSSGPGEQS